MSGLKSSIMGDIAQSDFLKQLKSSVQPQSTKLFKTAIS